MGRGSTGPSLGGAKPPPSVAAWWLGHRPWQGEARPAPRRVRGQHPGARDSTGASLVALSARRLRPHLHGPYLHTCSARTSWSLG